MNLIEGEVADGRHPHRRLRRAGAARDPGQGGEREAARCSASGRRTSSSARATTASASTSPWSRSSAPTRSSTAPSPACAEDEQLTAQQITARISSRTPPQRGSTVRLEDRPEPRARVLQKSGDRLSGPRSGRQRVAVDAIEPPAPAGGRSALGPVGDRGPPRRSAIAQPPVRGWPVPRFLSAQPDTRLITLPWETPLAEWPRSNLVALPRGISRHVVRFVRVGHEVYAVKEVLEHLARARVPAAARPDPAGHPRRSRPIGVVTDRVDADGEPLDPILITRHLQFSLPYRSLFTRGVRQDTVNRLVDAMVVLLARLHLIGFLWGDVLAVQHAVPARRRRLRRVPGRRRDRRAARPADRRPARARPDHRPDEPVRRVLRPGGRRAAGRGARPAGSWSRRSRPATASCGTS